MITISNLKVVTPEEISLGSSYILMSTVAEQLYILSESDKQFVKLFGRPQNYAIFSCYIESNGEVPGYDTTTFSACECPGMYKYVKNHGTEGDLAILWD